MPAYGRLIHDFCEQLGIDACAALVGNSMGGFIAHRGGDRGARALRAPGPGLRRRDQLRRVRRAERSTPPAGMVKAASPLRSAATGALVWTRPRGRKLAFGRLFRYPNRLRPELLAEQVRPGLQAPGLRRRAARRSGGYDIRDRLPEIEIPTMVVWGLNDRIVPVEAALSYHRLIPDSRLEIFERTGHLPQLERPARFNAAARRVHRVLAAAAGRAGHRVG